MSRCSNVTSNCYRMAIAIVIVLLVYYGIKGIVYAYDRHPQRRLLIILLCGMSIVIAAFVTGTIYGVYACYLYHQDMNNSHEIVGEGNGSEQIVIGSDDEITDNSQD